MRVQGYQKKTKSELLKAIDDCVSIGQLCALVQHERIVIRMKSQACASSLPQRKLTEKDFIPVKSPLDMLKEQVKEAVNNGG